MFTIGYVIYPIFTLFYDLKIGLLYFMTVILLLIAIMYLWQQLFVEWRDKWHLGNVDGQWKCVLCESEAEESQEFAEEGSFWVWRLQFDVEPLRYGKEATAE